jgi:hypothetical protein
MGGVRVEITIEGGSLVFKQGALTAPLRLAGSDGLVVTPPGAPPIRLSFARGADGRVAYLYQSSRALARQD